jgi:hypothetical protein
MTEPNPYESPKYQESMTPGSTGRFILSYPFGMMVWCTAVYLSFAAAINHNKTHFPGMVPTQLLIPNIAWLFIATVWTGFDATKMSLFLGIAAVVQLFITIILLFVSPSPVSWVSVIAGSQAGFFASIALMGRVRQKALLAKSSTVKP